MKTTKVLMKYKCWGIGLGRTGTKSLLDALHILGYEKVLHNPAFFEDLLQIDAAAEACCQLFYKYLDARFTDSKFILTTRSLKSWLNSNYRAHVCPNPYPKERIPQDSRFYDAMVRNRMTRWGTMDYDPKILTETYYRHHLDVVRHFAGRDDKLLIMNLHEGDGWEVLCPFLELPIPDVPFPCNNDKYHWSNKEYYGKVKK